MIRIMYENITARPGVPLGPTIKVVTIDVTPERLISMVIRLRRYQQMNADIRYSLVVNGQPLSEEQIYHAQESDECAALVLEQLQQKAAKRRALARQQRPHLGSENSKPLTFGL